MKKNMKWIIFGVLVVIFGIFVYAVTTNKIVGFDNAIYKIVTTFTNPVLDNLYKVVTFFGSVAGIIIFGLALLIFMKDKKMALWIVGGTAGSTILNNIIKFIVRRERPLVRRLVEEKSFSFPSGHTMGSVAFYGMIIFFILHSNLSKNKKIIYSSIFTLLTIAIMVSRIYLGAHFASDVCAGAVAALAFLIVFTSFIKTKK